MKRTSLMTATASLPVMSLVSRPCVTRAVLRLVVVVFSLLATGFTIWPSIHAATDPPPASGTDLRDGDLVIVRGTPHLFLVRDGTVHWLADTRVAADQQIVWERQVHVEPAQVLLWDQQGMLGDPLLSFPLVREEPAPPGQTCCPVYVVRQEVDDPQPRLYWVRDLLDLEVLGITSQNYGSFVVDSATFRDRFGLDPALLERTEFRGIGAGSLTAWPPRVGADVSFATPARWQVYGSGPDFQLPGQSLVTSLYRTDGGLAFLWITALREADYPGETAEGVLRMTLAADAKTARSLNSADLGWPLTATDLAARARPLALGGGSGAVVEYRWDGLDGSQIFQRVAAVKRGNVLWTVQYWTLTARDFATFLPDVESILASMSFSY